MLIEIIIIIMTECAGQNVSLHINVAVKTKVKK